jgi:hypothetical protein
VQTRVEIAEMDLLDSGNELALEGDVPSEKGTATSTATGAEAGAEAGVIASSTDAGLLAGVEAGEIATSEELETEEAKFAALSTLVSFLRNTEWCNMRWSESYPTESDKKKEQERLYLGILYLGRLFAQKVNHGIQLLLEINVTNHSVDLTALVERIISSRAPPITRVIINDEFNDLKVDELKAILKQKSLPFSGKKADLLMRVRENNIPLTPPTTTTSTIQPQKTNLSFIELSLILRKACLIDNTDIDSMSVFFGTLLSAATVNAANLAAATVVAEVIVAVEDIRDSFSNSSSVSVAQLLHISESNEDIKSFIRLAAGSPEDEKELVVPNSAIYRSLSKALPKTKTRGKESKDAQDVRVKGLVSNYDEVTEKVKMLITKVMNVGNISDDLDNDEQEQWISLISSIQEGVSSIDSTIVTTATKAVGMDNIMYTTYQSNLDHQSKSMRDLENKVDGRISSVPLFSAIPSTSMSIDELLRYMTEIRLGTQAKIETQMKGEIRSIIEYKTRMASGLASLQSLFINSVTMELKHLSFDDNAKKLLGQLFDLTFQHIGGLAPMHLFHIEPKGKALGDGFNKLEPGVFLDCLYCYLHHWNKGMDTEENEEVAKLNSDLVKKCHKFMYQYLYQAENTT